MYKRQGKTTHGDNERNLKGGGYFKGTADGDTITVLGLYPNDIVDADVIFLADE